MRVTKIPFKKTGFFSKLMVDYLDNSEHLKQYYNNFPKLESFKKQIVEKGNSYKVEQRNILVNTLLKQYNNFDISSITKDNISKLANNNTFTITTGHQLNLFTGPLYFLYKIIAVINLANKLKVAYPNHNFVPVYWMATEDHDFEEINYFNFKGKKIKWNTNQKGAVGRFSTSELEEVYNIFSDEIGDSKNAVFLKNLFKDAYLKHNTLADATRFIANTLFADQGLVILDGDDRQLKKLFVPYFKKELTQQISFKEISKTIKKLEKNYKIQVNPRELNLFYLGKDFRERIVFKDNVYKVLNTNILFTKEEILKELEQNPTAFSPNVVTRPLYQEVILPNLCYVGGGGELAYWLELKNYFKKSSIPYPILFLRNSVQIVSQKQFKKLEKLKISTEDIFLKQDELIAKKVTENSEIKINFEEKKTFLQQHFNDLKKIALNTDKSFINAVNAEETKQLKGLKKLEKRLLKAEKRKQKDLVFRIIKLQNELLPNQSLEERQRNISELYLLYGNSFFKALKLAIQPLELEFLVLEI